MSELDDRCLDAFPNWLRALPDDARSLAKLLEDPALPAIGKRRVAGALNYLFKSLDLIPDGIEDLGFVDDTFVLRVSAAQALDAAGGTAADPLARLAEEAKLVAELLGADYDRLTAYVSALGTGAARGRSVDAVLDDAAVRAELIREVFAWADGYTVPSFARDVKNLVKLKSFLSAKLPVK
jgi:uncharacterized membrane protein YkvA (DUF1232 family)